MYVKPWNKEVERIFIQLQRNGRACTKDIKLPRQIARRYPNLIDNEFMDIGRSYKKKRSWFILPPNVGMMPKRQKSKFMNFQFYRIY